MSTKMRYVNWVLFGGLSLLGTMLSGCLKTPYPIPYRFMESTRPLKPGKVRIEASGASVMLTTGGPGARVRIGVEKGHELGLSGYVHLAPSGSRLKIGGGLKLDWKYSPIECVSLVTGLGGSVGNVPGIGVDFGILFSPIRTRVRPYAGLRTGFMLALSGDAVHYFGLVGVLGMEIDITKYFAMVFEFGASNAIGSLLFLPHGSIGFQLTI